MARYEGMDEILQRLSLRFGQESPSSTAEPAGGASTMATPVPSLHYRSATESMGRLRTEAERLRETLGEPGNLTAQEHDELLALLGKIMQELWSCETALQRLAPFD